MEKKTQRKTSRRSRNKGGRPTIVTPETLQKLEYAFSMGLPDEQACLYANIAPQTLYNYQSKHPEFLERKVMLKQNITMRARLNIANEIANGSTKDSWEWLTRKEKQEFSLKDDATIHIANQNVLVQLPPLTLPPQDS